MQDTPDSDLGHDLDAKVPGSCGNGLAVSFTVPTPSDGELVSEDIDVRLMIQASVHSVLVDWDRTLRGWWSFDVSSGGQVLDLSSWSNTSSLQGGAVLQVGGVRGRHVSMDSGYVRVAADASLDLADPFTLSVFARFNDVGGPEQAIVGKCHGFAAYSLRLNLRNAGDRKVAVKVEDGVTDQFVVEMDGTVENGRWYHLAAVLEGGQLRLYVDGVLAASPLSGVTIAVNTFDLMLGADPTDVGSGGVAYPLNGDLDEVLLFSRALTQTEMAALRKGTSGTLSVAFADIVAGSHSFQGQAIDLDGNVCYTETRRVTRP